MLSLGWCPEVIWEPGCTAAEGEHAACWLLEALAPRALTILPPVRSDGMLVGALALVLFDAGHSQVAGATASLFLSFPAVGCFRREMEAR
eukprot:13319839-Alexandrium_andersonii.AAC.1